MKKFAVVLALICLGTAAQAQGPVTSYGPEENVFGSCRPAITLTNTTKDPIDYLQIDVRYQLRDGRSVVAEHKSRYEQGVAAPIAPAATRALVIHHDESTPFGAVCADVMKGTVVGFVCRTVSGQACAGMPGVRIGAELALPRRQ